jgi:hypothetical protein
VRGFSRDSRRNLLRRLASVDRQAFRSSRGRIVFVTLTYPHQYPEDPVAAGEEERYRLPTQHDGIREAPERGQAPEVLRILLGVAESFLETSPKDPAIFSQPHVAMLYGSSKPASTSSKPTNGCPECWRSWQDGRALTTAYTRIEARPPGLSRTTGGP